MKPRLVFTHLLVAALFLALAPSVAAAIWYVNGVNGNDNNNCQSPTTACKTIGHAISLAASGDSVKVASATYIENLTINFSLKLIGSGARTTIVDGGGAGRVVTISKSAIDVVLSQLTIRNGASGVSNVGKTLTINGSTISGNHTQNPRFCVGGGAGIHNITSALTINNSTVSGNEVSGNFFYPATCGGGILNYGGTVVINNSTVSGNATTGLQGAGGGIDNYAGSLTIRSSTVSGNSSHEGGGIAGAASFTNSIVANNPGGNCNGTITSTGYNLSSDGTCNLSGPGDLNNTNPLLGLLQYNGGQTQTMALLPGSPAIDSCNPSGCTDNQGHLLKTDQRGQPRPDKEDTGGCDMGAYERQSD